ncbi:MAG TPA: hypothetical protein VGM71_07170 [Luteibacter sp.]
MEERSRWLMRGWFVVLAVIAHLWLALMALASRTACVFPPCNASFAIESWRWLMSLPLFVTPWLQLPTDGWEFACTVQWVVLTVLNSCLAVALFIGTGKGATALLRRMSARLPQQ